MFYRDSQVIKAARCETLHNSSLSEWSPNEMWGPNLVLGLSGGERRLRRSRWKGRHSRKTTQLSVCLWMKPSSPCNGQNVVPAGTIWTSRPEGAEGRSGRAQEDFRLSFNQFSKIVFICYKILITQTTKTRTNRNLYSPLVPGDSAAVHWGVVKVLHLYFIPWLIFTELK